MISVWQEPSPSVSWNTCLPSGLLHLISPSRAVFRGHIIYWQHFLPFDSESAFSEKVLVYTKRDTSRVCVAQLKLDPCAEVQSKLALSEKESLIKAVCSLRGLWKWLLPFSKGAGPAVEHVPAQLLALSPGQRWWRFDSCHWPIWQEKVVVSFRTQKNKQKVKIQVQEGTVLTNDHVKVIYIIIIIK